MLMFLLVTADSVAIILFTYVGLMNMVRPLKLRLWRRIVHRNRFAISEFLYIYIQSYICIYGQYSRVLKLT